MHFGLAFARIVPLRLACLTLLLVADLLDVVETQFDSLLPEIIAYVLEMTGDPQTIKNARLTSRLLRDAGSLAVTTLQISDAYLPVAVLQTFSRATRFHVRRSGIPAAVYVLNVLLLLKKLPERTVYVEISAEDQSDPESIADSHIDLTADDSTKLAQQLVAAACLSSLQEVTLTLCITTEAADAILRGLSHLQHASLSVRSGNVGNARSAVWRPSADLPTWLAALHCG